MSEKKIYTKINRRIEVGDLVQCVRYDGECGLTIGKFQQPGWEA